VSAKSDLWLRAQGPSFAVALLVGITAGGTIGYMLIERWSAWDAFYMTVITVTTVGYGVVHPLSRAGEVFTVALIVGGVGSAFYTFTLLATFVVEGGVPRGVQRRRHERMLEAIKDHFIVCGYGRIGAIVAQQLQRQGVPFVVVDRDPERLKQAVEHGALGVEADASQEETLKRVGIERARGLIAVVSTDAENVYTVLSARVLRPDLFIVARAQTDDATVKLQRAGADRVISPYRIGAMQIAQTALRPAVVDFVALAIGTDNLELAMEEILIAPDATIADQSIIDANLRQQYGVIIVGIQRRDGRMDFNPEPGTAIRAGDKLVVLGRPDSLKRLEAEAARG
jgi:voltage-gated potassium channel